MKSYSWVGALVAIPGAVIGSGNFVEYHYSKQVWDYNAQLYELPRHTTVIVPAFNEEAYIGRTLESLVDQNVFAHSLDARTQLSKYRRYSDSMSSTSTSTKHIYTKQVLTDIDAYTTPAIDIVVVDSASTDKTAAIAARYNIPVLSAKRGKLNARDLGIQQAKGDIIVAVDADSYYPPNFLNLLLRHFQDENVVGVSSPRFYERGWMKPFTNLYTYLSRRMYGSNSAFRKGAYKQIGGFDLTIDQQDGPAMVQEEEKGFTSKLSAIGKVAFEPYAPVYTSPRRYMGDDKYKDEQDKGERFYSVICDICGSTISFDSNPFTCPKCKTKYGR